MSSKSKHAICCDDYIEIEEGNINVTATSKDGIHAKGHFNLEGGAVNITATSDAVECETGKIKVSGGSITSTIVGVDTKGLKCDSTLTVTGGNINFTVSGNQSKGLKSSRRMSLSGGNITINNSGTTELTASGVGYDPSYCSAIKSDSTITISGSSINITGTGTGNKGISSDQNIEITSGTVNVTTSGTGATYKNALNVTDTYSSTALTADGNISVQGGTLTTISSGAGGKGLISNETITIGNSNSSPTVNLTTLGSKFTVSTTIGTGGGPGGGSSTDYCHPKTFKADGDIIINNGNNTISSTDDGINSETTITINGETTTMSNSTEGVEAKTINMNGGNMYITASDDGINTTASTQTGGTESNDGSYLYMKGGVLTTIASSGDAIDSNGSIFMTGGILVDFDPSNNTNEDIDANGSIAINGGLLFGGCMHSQMFEIVSGTSQVGVNLKSSSAVSTTSGFIQIKDASGIVIGTFKTPQTYYNFHLSSPDMKTSTKYSIYTGGTVTGGYCTGGTYGGGTLKKSFTTGTVKISTLTL